MLETGVWVTSVNGLAGLFRDALLALVPIAERARMAWREPDAYDDWDHICEAIFTSLVIGSIENAEGLGGIGRLPNYDEPLSSYSDRSFVTNANSAGRLAFLRFDTLALPFDTCRFVELGEDGRALASVTRPFAQSDLMLAARRGATLDIVDRLDIRL